jgi:predicted ATPase/class 3 adenylate cyclase
MTSQILTFLYTDIEGSTRLWEQYPNSIEKNIKQHDRILRNAVEKNGGSIFRTVGDGICAVFENASKAVAAALQIQVDISGHSWDEVDFLKVRIAINTGEAEKQGSDYTGGSLNRIGRILGVTHGGQILISQPTRLFVRDTLPEGVSLKDLGEVHLRDLSSPENIYQLVHPDLPQDFPPIDALNLNKNNLPTQISPLIGREADLSEIVNRMVSEKVRMLTLTGPGGTGKTRLGLQAAADLITHFDNGVYFIDLASINEAERVLPSIARVLGVRETGSRPVLDELVEHLQSQKMLLLLDNMEQVTSAGPPLAALLLACPGLKLLLTSREPLNVRMEHIYPVPPLGLPASGYKQLTGEKVAQYESVRLFVDRAKAVKPDFQITDENASAVAEICIRLDGLPLAIELAASRIRLFPPQKLLERLDNRLSFLKGGAKDLPARQQTLRDTIGWSYELLDSPGQKLFELLSVFAGGASLDAIEAVAMEVERLEETGVDPIDGLTSLVDKSLVRQVEGLNGDPRFVMLGMIRDYAGERLQQDPGFYEDARRAYSAYFANFSKQQWDHIVKGQEGQALALLESEFENVASAWSFWVSDGDLEQLGKFIDSLWMLYDKRGWYHAMIDLTNDLLHVLSTTPSTPERAQQEIMLHISHAAALLVTKGYVSQEVEQAYNRARKLIEEQGEVPQLFSVLRGLYRYYSYRGEFEKSLQIGEQILSLAEKLDDSEMRVVGHLVLGTGYAFSNNLSLGLEHLEKGNASYTPKLAGSRRFRFGSDPGVASLMTSALLLWARGFPDKAIKRAVETNTLAQKLNQPFSIAHALFHTGLLHLWRREVDQAEKYSQSLMDLAVDYQFYIWEAVGSCLHGAALVFLGQEEQGLDQIQWGMEKYQGLKTPPIFWSLLVINQAEACLHAGKPEDGLALLAEIRDSADLSREGALGAEFCRLVGELLLASSIENQAEAEVWFQRGLDIAQTQLARMLELRLGLSLCRLWREQGKIEACRQLLNEQYQQMKEGHSIADMIEARSFLDELASGLHE